MKIRPVGSKSFHAERRADMTKQIIAFRNFANASKYRLAELSDHICDTVSQREDKNRDDDK